MVAGGGYEVFAGKEVARALAIMSLKAEDCTANLEGVTEKQLGTLKEWEDKFHTKYPVVGEVGPSFPCKKEIMSLILSLGSESVYGCSVS